MYILRIILLFEKYEGRIFIELMSLLGVIGVLILVLLFGYFFCSENKYCRYVDFN